MSKNNNKRHQQQHKQLKPIAQVPEPQQQTPQQPGVNPVDYQIDNLAKQIAQQSIIISKLETLLALAKSEIQQLKQHKPKE